jgi:hypothetical protein
MFSLGCTFYELVCRKQPPTRNVATKYAFDVQEFLYEVPRQTPKELVVLILDMCQLVPMKRPSANRVLERLAEIQQLLPPVDLSEATENHGQSSNPPATSAAILAKTPEQDDETSSSSSVDDSSSAVPTESGDVFLKLQRALSDQSNFETGSNGSAGGHFDVAQTIRRFSVTLKTAAGDMCVDPCWCSVTSSVKPRARKLFVGLLNDGGLHFWKTDKKDEFSKIRVLLEQASAVQHTEKNECLRLTSPLFPGVFWQLEFKNAQIADKWYNAMLGVIMRSDLNYHSRLRSGMHFGCKRKTYEIGILVLKLGLFREFCVNRARRKQFLCANVEARAASNCFVCVAPSLSHFAPVHGRSVGGMELFAAFQLSYGCWRGRDAHGCAHASLRAQLGNDPCSGMGSACGLDAFC